MEKERILALMRSGRAPHALLIAGPAGSGRKQLARRAATAWCTETGDVELLAGCANYFELSGERVSVVEVRAMIEQSALQGFNGGRRAFVLTDAHRMNASSQNALLKTLEEPPDGTVLILSGNESGLLPTIRSRCTIFRLGMTPCDAVAGMLAEKGIGAAEAAEAAQLADGVPGLAAQFADERSRQMLHGAVNCLSGALFGTLPFQEITALLGTPRQEGNAADEKDAARGKGAKKAKGTRSAKGERNEKDEKRKPDAENAQQIVFFWQALLRDALLACMGGAALRVPAQAAFTAKIARCFTISEIQGMIKNTIETEKQLCMNANPAQTLDAALVLLHDKEIGSWQR